MKVELTLSNMEINTLIQALQSYSETVWKQRDQLLSQRIATIVDCDGLIRKFESAMKD